MRYWNGEEGLGRNIFKLQSHIYQVEERVDIIEKKQGSIVEAHNDQRDVFEEHTTDIQWLKIKIAGLEDRSWRKKLQFRGIPESVTPSELIPYLQQILRVLLLETSKDFVIDKAHRLTKPVFLQDSVPRDIIARIYFFHIKERAYFAVRNMGNLPDPFLKFQIFCRSVSSNFATAQKLCLRDQSTAWPWNLIHIGFSNQTNYNTSWPHIYAMLPCRCCQTSTPMGSNHCQHAETLLFTAT